MKVLDILTILSVPIMRKQVTVRKYYLNKQKLISMKFRTQYNNHEHPKVANEKGDIKGKSMPEQSLTIRQMLERQRLGMPVMGNIKVPVYHPEEVFIPDFNSMDLAEIEELKRNLNNSVADLKKKYKEEYDSALRKKADDKQKQEKAIFERYQKQLEARGSSTTSDTEKPQ